MMDFSLPIFCFVPICECINPIGPLLMVQRCAVDGGTLVEEMPHIIYIIYMLFSYYVICCFCSIFV